MTAGDVLHRAATLLRSPLPHDWARCDYDLGPYCLRCACARAKFELDEAVGLGLSMVECLSGQLFQSDGPLIEAVRWVRMAEDIGEIDRTLPLSEGVASVLVGAALRGFVSQNPWAAREPATVAPMR